jgi:general nucleoside transport system ATP-binding protein
VTSPLLALEGITKVYDNGVVANKDIDFALAEGEIHAVCGENGAGKTTLMKILYGLEQPSRGRILVRGKEVSIASPRGAIALGIGMVHQHFMLVPSFTTTENLFLGEEPRKLGLFVDVAKARAEAEEVARKYGLPIAPAARVADISVGMMQKLEILKALHRGASILILDEPTAVLTPQEAEELFDELRQLKAAGHTIIFISHKLKEVMSISDRVTVIKRGRTLGTFPAAEVSEAELSRLMVGRDVAKAFEKALVSAGEARLRVEGLCCAAASGKGALRELSFSVRSGEIVGVAGVEGNGQRELVDALTGGLAARKGRILVDGEDVVGPAARRHYDIGSARKLGLAYIPEDRIAVGSAMDGSIEENLVANRLREKAFRSGPFMRNAKVSANARKAIEDYTIVASGPRQRLSMLSGGNVQKVVVARECESGPRLLVAEQPTRGVDVGAAEVIHRQLIAMRDSGVAILVVSADINEVLELCDRLIVLFEGEIVASIDKPAELSEEDLGLYMLGLKRQDRLEAEGEGAK